MLQIKKATRTKRKLRVAIDGPSGSGKTKTLLRLAFTLVRRGLAKKVLVIDTENDSASLYAGDAPDGTPFDFDALNLSKDYAPTEYVAAIEMGLKSGYDCIVIDSLSHAWVGEGGALDLVDRKSSGNSFTAWKDVTPLHRKLVDAVVQSPAHMLCSMRTKTEYVMEETTNSRGNKVVAPRRVGTTAVQREGFEYEFDVYGRMDLEHQIHIEKTRCDFLDGSKAVKPGETFWTPLIDWLEGASAEQVAKVVVRDDRTADERERDTIIEQIKAATTGDDLTAIATAAKSRGLSADLMRPVVEAGKSRRAELDAAAQPEPAAAPE